MSAVENVDSASTSASMLTDQHVLKSVDSNGSEILIVWIMFRKTVIYKTLQVHLSVLWMISQAEGFPFECGNLSVWISRDF